VGWLGKDKKNKQADRDRIQPGSIIAGKYRVEGLIGKGGMAMVVMARHMEIRSRVAIKLLREKDSKDAELVERFMREAKTAAKLRTEHAVKISDVGRQPNGAPFLVMELLEGEDLARVISRQPMSVPGAVECILQACEAIAEAHGLGIVHRDIKPKNLFLLPRRHDRPFIKVLDFGLAKHVSLMEDALALTATTAVLGSPHYMSPEQMRASKNVDARADIWSLGICLYELLTGRPPFPGDTVAVVCANVLKQEPIPLHAYLPNAPPELWAIIHRCLQKDPALRYATVAALVEVLIPFAPPHAQEAAQRIAKLVRALPTMIVSRGGGGTAGGRAVEDDADTHTGATLDSDPGARRSKWLLPIGLLIGSIVIATTAIALAIRFRPQAAEHHSVTREPAKYTPEPAISMVSSASPAVSKSADGGVTGLNGENGESATNPHGVDHGNSGGANARSALDGGGGTSASPRLKLGPSERF
jgi:serine/threonine protein kinase